MAITIDIQELKEKWLERKWPLMAFLANPGGETILDQNQWVKKGDFLFLTAEGWEVVKEELADHSHVCSWNIFAFQLWQRWEDEAAGLSP